MSAVIAEGTQVCAPLTPVQIANLTNAGSVLLVLDCAALSGIDVLLVEIARKARASTTLRNYITQRIKGIDIDAGIEPVHISIPVPVPGGGVAFVATLTLTVGLSNRSIPYSVELV